MSVGASLPAPEARADADPVPPKLASFGDPGFVEPATLALSYRDAGVTVVPPPGWLLAPGSSLDRAGDDQAYEIARFQLRLRDAALYAQPLPVTSGLLADAGAVLSLALAREDSDIQGVEAQDSETSYAGVTTFTRILSARFTHRTALVRAFVPAADRDAFASAIAAALASATVDADGPIGPAYVAPAPPPPPAPIAEPAAAAPVDPSSQMRAEIVARAALMLGTPYVWGGNSPGRALDCSAFVSAAWGVARYTTDSIWSVAVPIAKDDLLPGDAMDLETWRDPARLGHIRLFEAWANAAHTLVWVYEETPPRAIHRVIAYDASYQPMRLAGLSSQGVAPLLPAPAPDPRPAFVPAPSRTRPAGATPRPTRAATPRPLAPPWVAPTPHPTPRPTAMPTPTPVATARAVVTRRPTASSTHR